MVNARRAIVLGAIALVVGSILGAGCSTTRPPTPEDAARAAFPVRPREIPVDRIDPCELLNSTQVSQLSVKRNENSSTIDVDGTPSRICKWIGVVDPGQGSQTLHVGINVQFISRATEVTAALPGSVVGQVNGYGSVTQGPSDSRENGSVCAVAIDAAPERSIRVQALLRPYGPQISDDDLCRRATDAASMVMTTAVAVASR